jgi:hypothetical protein
MAATQIRQDAELHPNLVSLPPNELNLVRPPTNEEIEAALEKGLRERDECLRRLRQRKKPTW